MKTINLQWKTGFSIDLPSMEAWIKANAGANFVGTSADNKLTLWFTQDPNIVPSENVATNVTISPASKASVSLLGVTIEAKNNGTSSNITLVADGSTSIASVVSNWNSNNSSKKLQVISGDDTQIAPAGDIMLSGGAAAVTQSVVTKVPTGEPSQAQIIKAHWDSIDEQSELSLSYKSASTRLAEIAAKKASARTKLQALGLNEDELKAMGI